jgi:glutamyl-tRNA reductase
MPEILVVGISHHTAPLDVREKLSTATEATAEELRQLLAGGDLAEGVLLSTCNRVELYAAAEDPVVAARKIRSYLESRAAPTAVSEFLFERWGEDAIRHAFRVASSLDSMVVGEPQILGQVKQAVQAAEAAGATGALLGRCMNRAFAVAKRVRSETDIAAGTVSVSSVAVELAEKIFGQLAGRRAMLLGAGEMSEAAAKSLVGRGVRLAVVNRSPERAERLAAEFGGEAAPYEHLSTELGKADVVVTSTASTRFVITRELMKDVMKLRRHRPLFIIDIAVPRDVDPRVEDLDNIFLYDVDDLQEVAGHNLAARKRAAEAAEKIISEETSSFEQWRRGLSLTPTIVGLRTRFQEIVQAELARTLPRLDGLSEKDQKTLHAMVNAMVNKLLHHPLTELKKGAEGPDAAHLIDAARQLFDLDIGEERPSRERIAPDEAEGEVEAVPELAAASQGGKAK